MRPRVATADGFRAHRRLGMLVRRRASGNTPEPFAFLTGRSLARSRVFSRPHSCGTTEQIGANEAFPIPLAMQGLVAQSPEQQQRHGDGDNGRDQQLAQQARRLSLRPLSGSGHRHPHFIPQARRTCLHRLGSVRDVPEETISSSAEGRSRRSPLSLVWNGRVAVRQQTTLSDCT